MITMIAMITMIINDYDSYDDDNNDNLAWSGTRQLQLQLVLHHVTKNM